jgi:hypothetical protein
VAEIHHMALSAHVLRAVTVTLKSVCYEGHFTFEAEKFLGRFTPSNCNGMREICHIALPEHTLCSLQVRVQADSHEGHFTLEDVTVFLTYLPSHCSGVN